MTPAVKIILTEAIKAGLFDDVIRDVLPTNPEDKAALLAYLMSEKIMRNVGVHPAGITTEATA